MYDAPPFSVNQRMIDLVFRIGEKVSSIEGYERLDPSPRLRKQNRIRSIYSSCAIEANSLTLGQVSDIINGHRVVGPENDILEVKNAVEAYSRLGDFDPYSISDLLKMHGVLTKGVTEESGSFRTKGEGVFSGDRCIFLAPPPERVRPNMENLFSWLNETRGEMNPLIASCVFHYEFVFIHPFTDGNGRMARLWQTAILGRWREIFHWIPVENRIEMAQREYYDVIDRCNNSGNSNAFIEFMLQIILNALEDTEHLLKCDMEGIPAQVSRLLVSIDGGEWYTSKQLMEVIGLKSRATFQTNYLRPALDRRLLEMEYPDSPRSNRQRYRIRERFPKW